MLVLQADGGPLVGMSLLYGNRVMLEVVDNGDVTIDSYETNRKQRNSEA